MPAPLLDRMEVIELPGYTPEEKLHIAMRHLIPRVLDQHGITNQHVEIPEVHIMGNRLLSALCWFLVRTVHLLVNRFILTIQLGYSSGVGPL